MRIYNRNGCNLNMNIKLFEDERIDVTFSLMGVSETHPCDEDFTLQDGTHECWNRFATNFWNSFYFGNFFKFRL